MKVREHGAVEEMLACAKAAGSCRRFVRATAKWQFKARGAVHGRLAAGRRSGPSLIVTAQFGGRITDRAHATPSARTFFQSATLILVKGDETRPRRK